MQKYAIIAKYARTILIIRLKPQRLLKINDKNIQLHTNPRSIHNSLIPRLDLFVFLTI